MSPPAELAALRSWVAGVLGRPAPDWEVTPETTAVLSRLHRAHARQEQAGQAEAEALQQARAEYRAEADRLQRLLGAMEGLQQEMGRGPTHAYLATLTELCLALGVDTAAGSRLETKLCDLLVRQAEVGPRLGLARAEVERREAETVELHAGHAGLQAVCEVAEAEARNQEPAVANHVKKTDFTLAKLEQYKKDVQRGEAVLAKNGGSDPSLRHRPVGLLLEELRGVQEAAEPLVRQMEGFLSLPPSMELATVEVAARRDTLRRLEIEVQQKISSLHI